MSTNAKSATTQRKGSRDSMQSEKESAQSVEEKQSESSQSQPLSDSLEEVGQAPTEEQQLGDLTIEDNIKKGSEDLKSAVDRGIISRPNTLLLDPGNSAKQIGTFTLFVNGHIEEGSHGIGDPNARVFKVLAVQVTRSIFKATAQPLTKEQPPWWTPGYGKLVVEFLKEKQKDFQALNERKFDCNDGRYSLIPENDPWNR